ncbi:MAG: hypothetical protein ACRD0K_11540 [Egibacteraceae bacterium]
MRTVLSIVLATALLVSACGGTNSAAESTRAPDPLEGLPLAPDSARVDLAQPTFSNPTTVTHPLFPISDLRSVVLLGNVDGHELRTETTLLPGTKTIDVNGQPVEALISQYVAYLDGRIEEVALDWYAQADDGAVWYLGEDVSNYQDGVVADKEGTWLAGREGPPAMIMPADPRIGNVYRSENAPGIVFEEVTVSDVGQTVDGPSGAVAGAMVADELHMDGTREDKIFAPGYGEFSTGRHGSLEALALAVPTDALPGPPPAELVSLSAGAAEIFDAAEAGNWDAASASLDRMRAAWDTYRAAGVPRLLGDQMSRALDALTGDALAPAVNGRNPAGARKAAIDVAMASLDLQLRHRPPAEIDLGRFDLWTRQLAVDAAADDPGAVSGDVSTLEWVWDRIAHTLNRTVADDIDAQLGDLRTAADDEDLAAAADGAQALVDTLAGLQP